MNTRASKEQIRESQQKKITALSADEWNVRSQALIQSAQSELIKLFVKSHWNLYWAFSKEFQAQFFSEYVKDFSFVRIDDAAEKILSMRKIRNEEDWEDILIGDSILKQPRSTTKVYIPTEDLVIIVPGLAFDQCGGRLGRGKGYYDRFLAKYPQAVKIGVALDFQVLDELPLDSWDIKMDALLTEQGFQEF